MLSIEQSLVETHPNKRFVLKWEFSFLSCDDVFQNDDTKMMWDKVLLSMRDLHFLFNPSEIQLYIFRFVSHYSTVMSQAKMPHLRYITINNCQKSIK